MSAAAWLAFGPAYTAARGNQPARLGAHAFREGAPRSLCGYVERTRVRAEANAQDRRCRWCERVVAGRSRDLSESIAPTGWAP